MVDLDPRQSDCRPPPNHFIMRVSLGKARRRLLRNCNGLTRGTTGKLDDRTCRCEAAGSHLGLHKETSETHLGPH